jgi:hypothetical protein
MNIRISQIYFEPRQLSGLDPAFLPYDNSSSTNADYREFYVFQKEYLAGKIPTDTYVGYVSWKFQKKSRMSGRRFIEFCEANPGYDVYLVNPFPLFIALGNVWDCGETKHPGIKELTQYIFDSLNYGISVNEVPNSLRLNAYCNFWVGNRKFWDSYMKFCLPIVDFIEKRMDAQHKAKLFSRADRRSNASYFAYIFERLFTTFLASHPEIKSLSYRYSKEELGQEHTKNEIALLEDLARFEDAHPNLVNPLKHDPALESRLKRYWSQRWNDHSALGITRRTVQFFWHLVPYRLELIRNPVINKVTEFALRRLSHDPKFSIDSKD